MKVLRHVVGLLTAVAVMVCAAPAWAADGFNPAAVNVTLGPGESTHVSKTLHLDALPGKADIVIAIDTTGSMCDAIAQAKADATNIVNQVQTAIPGARFALIDFKDYSDYPPNGYHVVVPLTSSAAVFQAGANTLVCGGGSDAPEAYAAVYHASTSDPLLAATYDPGASRFLVVLGDAAPHDANLHASFPACDDTPPTDPVGPTSVQLNAMNAAGIKLLMIHYTDPGTSTSLACMQQQAAVTGGNAVEQGGDLASQIIASITNASSHINTVDLVVNAGCRSAISFDPPPPYGPFTAPVDISFTETITAPTTPGSYDCTVTALVDGTARAVERACHGHRRRAGNSDGHPGHGHESGREAALRDRARSGCVWQPSLRGDGHVRRLDGPERRSDVQSAVRGDERKRRRYSVLHRYAHRDRHHHRDGRRHDGLGHCDEDLHTGPADEGDSHACIGDQPGWSAALRHRARDR